MDRVYQVTICGKVLESVNLKQLLARAVFEKRNMDRTLRMFSDLRHHVFAGCMTEARAVASGQIR